MEIKISSLFVLDFQRLLQCISFQQKKVISVKYYAFNFCEQFFFGVNRFNVFFENKRKSNKLI